MNSDNNFDKWRDMFSDDKSELPDDFKWEYMEDDILDKMKKEQSRRPVFIIVFIVFGCILFLIGIGWSYIWNNDNIQMSKEIDKIENSKSKQNTSQSSDVSIATIESKKPKTLPIETKNQTKTNQNFEINNTEISETVFKNNIQRTTQKVVQNDYNRVPKIAEINELNEKSNQIGTNIPMKEKQANINEIIPKSSFENELANYGNLNSTYNDQADSLLVKSVNFMAALSLIKVNEIKSLEDNLSGILLRPTVAKQKLSKLPKNYISITGGVTSWDLNYNKVVPERDAYEKTILSYHTQLNYTHRFNNNFVFIAGIRYQNLETEFNYSTFIDNYKIIRLSDTIISVKTNAITGQQTRIKGDVDINVSANRRVRHFNRYQLYQIPLSMGKAWAITKKWSTEISLGTAVNIYAYNRGRTLFQGNILDFGGSETPFMDNRWGIEGMASLKIRYKINDQLGLLLDGSIQQSMTNWSTEDKVSLLPVQKSIGLGMYFTY